MSRTASRPFPAMNETTPSQPLPLFPEPPSERIVGGVRINVTDARDALTKASGFMDAYDFTCNPYSGCSFGCSYCYAAFFARGAEAKETWGEWLVAKQNVVSLLRRKATAGKLEGRKVYLSSVTDPYVPIERDMKLTRGLLEIMSRHDVSLVVQTRSPLVTRDIDLFRQFRRLRVQITVTTDSEEVRKAFEPKCPANRQRLDAASELVAAGVPTRLTLTPLLPIEDVDRFAESLLATGVREFVVQPFHAERGKFVRGTREGALELCERYGWTRGRYGDIVDKLVARLPMVIEGRDGFLPAEER